MDQAELKSLLDELIARWENEVVEFKQASNDYSTDDIGKYFSALANEAKLRGAESGWLVFGVNNRLEKFGQADRTEINKLLLDKLSDALTDQQKYNKVSNLLGKLRRLGTIENTGSDAAPCWRLAKKN